MELISYIPIKEVRLKVDRITKEYSLEIYEKPIPNINREIINGVNYFDYNGAVYAIIPFNAKYLTMQIKASNVNMISPQGKLLFINSDERKKIGDMYQYAEKNLVQRNYDLGQYDKQLYIEAQRKGKMYKEV